MSEHTFDTLDDFLEDAASRESGNEVTLTIRSLVRTWGMERRGTSVVHRIKNDLTKHGLSTEPNFEFGWIDNFVKLVRNDQHPSKLIDNDGAVPSTDSVDGSLKVGVIESAVETNVVTVDRNARLEEAQALMIRHNFSQLPVMSGKREIVGAISWESIAIAKMHRNDITLKDCITEVHVVKVEDDLLPLIPEITKRGYIVVVNPDKTVSGIVTSADISDEFITMAGPFLLIGECERYLRNICGAVFSIEEIRAAKNGNDSEREVAGPEDLTFGEMSRLFTSVETWSRLSWQAERKCFIDALDDGRKIRNDIMHFSTDAISEQDRNTIINLTRWLKVIYNSLDTEA